MDKPGASDLCIIQVAPNYHRGRYSKTYSIWHNGDWLRASSGRRRAWQKLTSARVVYERLINDHSR